MVSASAGAVSNTARCSGPVPNPWPTCACSDRSKTRLAPAHQATTTKFPSAFLNLPGRARDLFTASRAKLPACGYLVPSSRLGFGKLADPTCSLHDKKPSTSSAPATCRFLFGTLKNSVRLVRGGLSRMRAASEAQGSSGGQEPRVPRLGVDHCGNSTCRLRALPVLLLAPYPCTWVFFFSYLVSCCVSVALSCLLRTATPSFQDAQGGGGNPRTPPARGSRLGGGVRRQLGWFLRAPLRSVLPSTLDAQSTGSFWHFSMHSRALVVVLGVLAIRIHDLKNRLGSTEDTDPACFCRRMWFCTGKQLPTCCFFSLGHSCFFVQGHSVSHSGLVDQQRAVHKGWGCAVEARPWPFRLPSAHIFFLGWCFSPAFNTKWLRTRHPISTNSGGASKTTRRVYVFRVCKHKGLGGGGNLHSRRSVRA